MSFDIHMVVPATSAPALGPVSRTAHASPTAASVASDEAVHVDTIPSSPPPEVHDAIAVAAESYKQLQAAGRQLQFQLNARTGKVTIEVHDPKGNLLFSVPASKALDVAAGGSLE